MTSRRFKVLRISSWDKFRDTIESRKFESWTFRGQSNAGWPLYSSLSRYFKSYQVHPDAWQRQERRILRIFKRKAHLLLEHLPEASDSFEWLALMQHHGAPTRLLDFTWSPFVAAFFALERATDEAAVWALFPPGLIERPNRTVRPIQRVEADEIAPWVEGSYEKHFVVNEHHIAMVGEPHRMNQRIIAQSGTFVIPGVLAEPIETLVPSSAVVKFVLDAKKLRRRAMEKLYLMNISNATLFPGLDGLARSLAYELEFHWAFDPVTMKPRRGYPAD